MLFVRRLPSARFGKTLTLLKLPTNHVPKFDAFVIALAPAPIIPTSDLKGTTTYVNATTSPGRQRSKI
jgi:hypothetical protein